MVSDDSEEWVLSHRFAHFFIVVVFGIHFFDTDGYTLGITES